MTLLAAFSALLRRYTGQDDVVVGTPIAGRDRREIEGLIGFFVNTLRHARRPRRQPTVPRAARPGAGDARSAPTRHQDLPFERLVDELQPERDLSRTPLFQVMFVLQNTAGRSGLGRRAAGSSAEPIAVSHREVRPDLSSASPTDGSLRWPRVRTDLFDAATIERLTGHFATAAGGDGRRSRGERSPSCRCCPGRAAPAAASSGTPPAATRPDATLPAQLFEAQVERTPGRGRPSSTRTRALTYGELNARANQLARSSAGTAVSAPETLVGLCLERVAGDGRRLLAILKAGGAYLPLDPQLPGRAARATCSTTPARGAHHPAAARRDRCGRRCRRLPRRGWRRIAAQSDESRRRAVPSPDNLAYVIYTSGSTGRPKGVDDHAPRRSPTCSGGMRERAGLGDR